MVDEGATAYLECNIDANPTTDTTITWRRRFRNESDGTSTQPIDSDRMRVSVEGIDATTSHGSAQISLKGTLIIYNASLEDSGHTFECVANNGVGDTDTAITTLLVLRQYILNIYPKLFNYSNCLSINHLN